MRKLPKRRKANLVRLIIAIVTFLTQLALFFYALYSLNIFSLSIYIIFQMISAITAVTIVNSRSNPSYKIAWITLILCVPFLGTIFYAMWGRGDKTHKRNRKFHSLAAMSIPLYKRFPEAELHFSQNYPQHQRIADYLQNSGFPIYEATASTYYSQGEEFFSALIEKMKKAEKFIFLEFFIVAKGEMWEQIFSILKEKAAEGLDIRFMYDDMGCISTLPHHFDVYLSQYGIKAVRFNRVIPIVNNFYLNYRNHQKICVIDGEHGFTGGVNIADEYCNLVEAYGHWKDSGLLLQGTGVWSLTIMFLQLWNHAAEKRYPEHKNYVDYIPSIKNISGKGFVQPFCDGPFNNPKNPAEGLYMQMINTARKYIYITTPYLVLDNEMSTALCTAASSGIDVRIITPGIPDKKYVYTVTRSYYGQLIKFGVKIYEYTPGFIHSKNVVCDDETAIVGTVNMDFRSFYLHFENGVWLCGANTVSDIKKDFMQTLAKCRQMDMLWWRRRPWYYRLLQSVLRVFAPML